MVDIEKILESIYEVLKDEVDKVFLFDRPESVAESLKTFIVLRPTSSLTNMESSDNSTFEYYECGFSIEVFVRDKVSASNPNQARIGEMSRLVQSIISKFPIRTGYARLYRPSVFLQSKDGKGFHVTVIHSNLTTLF